MFKCFFFFLQCTDKLERDRLILFLNKLILNKVGSTVLFTGSLLVTTFTFTFPIGLGLYRNIHWNILFMLI